MNKFLFGIVLVPAIIDFALGYNFEDSYFNELLARDLDEFDEVLIHRTRRDDDVQKCKRKHWRLGCCADETFEEMHEKDKEMKRECIRQVGGKDGREKRYLHRDPFKCDNVDKHRKEATCVMECMLKKKGILDSDGTIKEEAFKAHIKDVLHKETWISPMLDKIASKCLDEMRNATAAPASVAAAPGSGSESESASCNPAGIKLSRCLYKEIQMSCPADQIKDEKACVRVRDRIKRNEEFFPPHPQPQMEDDN